MAPGVTTTWIAWFRDWRWWMWYVAGRVRQLQADRVAPPAGQVTEAMVRYFHSRGIVVRAWGVGRDESLASRMISLGVDGMTFDDPRVDLPNCLTPQTPPQLPPRGHSMTGADVRDLDVPSVVAAVRDTDKFAALKGMLDQAHFWDTRERPSDRDRVSRGP
ncbi:MAG: hypothetical protein CM1200mP2_12570 [Planctomycetaceae bacterium]|nr:MAG: hypothetical protein CM1200mP2_12570 [Planctomycetaceae bacterium]